MAAHAGVSERVQRVIVETLNIAAPSEETDLIESGLLDSLALVDLILAIEREFAISLPLDRIDVDNFRTIRSIGHSVAGANGHGSA